MKIMVLEAIFNDAITALIEKIVYVMIIILIASMIAKAITMIISRFGKRSDVPESVTRVINKIITYFIAFIGLVLILDVFKLNINTFLASFGIVGLIIGLSSQTIISNFIAGIIIIIEKPFKRGDIIDIVSLQGTVEDISIRSTRVKSLDGKLITIPNSTFNTSPVINYSRTGRIQVKIPISFTPDTDIEKLRKLMILTVNEIKGIRPFHIELIVTGITLSGLSRNIVVEFRFWIDRFIEKDMISSKFIKIMHEKFKTEKIIVTSEIKDEVK